MDELRAPAARQSPEPGMLGDIVLCPGRARAGAGGRPRDRTTSSLLLTHGILHLLGYDHAEPEEEEEMFGLQDELLDAWRGRG